MIKTSWQKIIQWISCGRLHAIMDTRLVSMMLSIVLIHRYRYADSKVTRGEAEDGVIRRNGKTCSDSIIFSGTPRLHTLTKFVESPKYSVISPT